MCQGPTCFLVLTILCLAVLSGLVVIFCALLRIAVSNKSRVLWVQKHKDLRV